MYVLDNVGFICHPNTGSRSLREALLKVGGKAVKGHHDVCAKTFAQTRACVCVIRNPYDMMASWYCRKHKPSKFDEWLLQILRGRRSHEGYQPCGLLYGLNWATHVVKFEDLPGSLNIVTDNLGLPRLILGHEGKSGRTSDYYHSLYDRISASLVKRAYGNQIKAGHYRL